MTELENPATRLGCLQIAHADLKVFFPEVGAQVAGFRQQRIRERDPVFRFTGTDQRQRGDLLKTTATEQTTQTAFGLLGRCEASRNDRIRQMGTEAIEAHETGHLLDQIDFAAEILSA